MSSRDENRHLDVKREFNYRMSDLIDRYWMHYGRKKLSAEREKSIIEGIRSELGRLFVREVDGMAVQRWYENLTGKRALADNTAVRHFMIWSKDTGLALNPADQVEVYRPDDARDRYLSIDELRALKAALDERMYRKGTKDFNKTNLRLRLLVLIDVGTGMRSAEIFRLCWSDVMYGEGLLAVRSKLKKGKIRYIPMPPELAVEMRKYPAVIGEDRIFPPEPDAKSGRQRVEGSFEDLLARAKIRDFRFHDLRHTFASWHMMCGGDLYELTKILGHSDIMTERYAKLGRQHLTKTGNTAREVWKLMEEKKEAHTA